MTTINKKKSKVIYNILDTKKQPNLEIIKWMDHASLSAHWHDLETVTNAQPLEITSVGWVMLEDDKKVILETNSDRFTDSGNHSGVMVVLKSCITKRYKLKDPTIT